MSKWKSPIDELNEYQKKILPERICPECGKRIVRVCFNNYAYRRGGKVYCSWTCYRKEYHRKKENVEFPEKNCPTSRDYGVESKRIKRKRKKRLA